MKINSIVVILPVYNGGHYLKESVSSVLAQDFQDYKLLVLDDCSSDGSWEYLQSLQSSRVELFRNKENRGLFYNLNYLIKNSDAPLIKLWSQDDVMAINLLSEIVAFHEANPEIGFSYTGVRYIDANSNEIVNWRVDSTPPIVDPKLHKKIAFRTGSIAGNIANVTLSRRALNRVGLFNERMKIAGDTEMWFRISIEFPIGFINKKLVCLRNHAGQLSRQEKYYLNHLEEEIECFEFLLRSCSDAEKREGRKVLRENKLQFYMVIMFRALFKGDFKTVRQFWQILSEFDNIFLLVVNFLRLRIVRLGQVIK
jgi:glycosyltransferase involved in cell wall biosynthesis